MSLSWRCVLFRREDALCNVGVRAMLVCLPCFANMRECLHAGGGSILLRMKTALCSADVGAMTGANKQTQCFGFKLSSVLAQSETAGEREVSVTMLLGRGVHSIYMQSFVYHKNKNTLQL